MNSLNQKALTLLGIGLPLCSLSLVLHTNLIIKLLMTFTSVGLIFWSLMLTMLDAKMNKEEESLK
ncbi:hypothetical protein NQ129_20145 [Priestia aryabhattai]|uniref:hypothetical protein n=1 Tax=Priestia aryabhattai TaxID=412384 RepID=UPI00211BA1BA|nr:hypothetical protein [Priestia aryabhattai]MCQ9284099.1 hypothetical protein [Priestia aryabhattai]